MRPGHFQILLPVSKHKNDHENVTVPLSQCDKNSLMDCARQETYRVVYSVVHDLGFHHRGPYWLIMLER